MVMVVGALTIKRSDYLPATRGTNIDARVVWDLALVASGSALPQVSPLPVSIALQVARSL